MPRIAWNKRYQGGRPPHLVSTALFRTSGDRLLRRERMDMREQAPRRALGQRSGATARQVAGGVRARMTAANPTEICSFCCSGLACYMRCNKQS